MMQQKMPWEEDWSQPQSGPVGAVGYPTITTPRDPRQVAREDRSDLRARRAEVRADRADARAAAAAERVAINDAARLDLERRRLAIAEQTAAAEQQGKQDFEAVRAEALDKIRLARSLQQRSREGWFATGIGAPTASRVAGTGAYDVRQDTDTLKNAGALTRIMEMARANGGKNPLTPLSNSDFQALANSLSNLDIGQSDTQYQANIQRVIDLYSRAYQGAGGTDLEGDLDPATRNAGRSAVGAPAAIASGSTRADRNPERERALDGLIRSGADMATINATSRAMGGLDLDSGQVDRWRAFYKAHPDYRGSSINTAVEVPTTGWNRFAASPVGTGVYAAVDAGMAGLTDEFASAVGGGDLAELNARKQAAFSASPIATITGQVVGTIGGMAGLGALGRTTGVASRFTNPGVAGDLTFGAISGFGQSNDNRALGAGLGAAGGLVGNYLGNQVANGIGAVARTGPGLSATNTVRRIFGRQFLERVPPLDRAQTSAFEAIERAGINNISSTLDEASSLRIPMSLADVDPNLRELAGAAVRRSPAASAYAEDALLPRNQGQFDRLASSVETNLGPTTNVPQRSADLTAQARTAAAPLYDRAYNNPVPTTSELDAVLGTPFGRQALGRARTIAANERRSPDELGFAVDADGNVVLNSMPNDAIARHLGARAELDSAQEAYRVARSSPNGSVDQARERMLAARASLRDAERALAAAPDPSMPASVPAYTTQTLDYVKRGMDDVLEEQRNPITGKLVLDEAGRAQSAVRGQLLDEIDRLNPDFAAARAAYAGPVASRDALARGGDAYRLHPDELVIQVGNQTPEHLGQMQLGYRSALVDHAASARDSSNPWEVTLGSPMARSRIETLYPGDPGVERLFRQRDLERQMQQTTNAVLGNSRTAQRQIADQSFLENPAAQGAVEVGTSMLTGGVPIATMMRVAGASLKDRAKLGAGKQAERRAELLAPVLLNTDPSAALATALDLLAQQRARTAFVEATKPKRLGLFGRGVGSQAAVAPLNR